MPSGRTHDRITWLSLPLIAMLAYLFTRRGDWIFWLSGAYLFSGLMFGPDLDIYSIQYKRWGIIRWIWLPYQSCLKHRSFLSHGFLIGTILRLIYLTTIMMILAILGVAIAQLIWGFSWNWQDFTQNSIALVRNRYLGEVMVTFIGLELGAMSHSVSDHLGTAFKRFQQKKLQPRLKKKMSSRTLKKGKK
ncbi:MAG: metal-binding protein [Cyanobacteria bacterium P01_G01_bin.49]